MKYLLEHSNIEFLWNQNQSELREGSEFELARRGDEVSERQSSFHGFDSKLVSGSRGTNSAKYLFIKFFIKKLFYSRFDNLLLNSAGKQLDFMKEGYMDLNDYNVDLPLIEETYNDLMSKTEFFNQLGTETNFMEPATKSYGNDENKNLNDIF